jgi:gamma-glutamyl hydrolase
MPSYKGASYFPASYVKWVESGGARAVPIPYTLPADQIQTLLSSLNGVLFTGGAASFFEKNGQPSPFALSAKVVFDEVVSAAKAGETFPLWGTCLGHELTLTLASGLNQSVVTSGFDSENISWPLLPTQAASTSRLWGSAPPDVWSALTENDITMNSHQAGVSPQNFLGSPALVGSMKILSIGNDREGRQFVSSTEGITLPVYTTQFHPEKPMFEWNPQMQINHTDVSIVGNSYTARFFVSQAKQNSRAFPSQQAEAAALIYNYNAVDTSADTEFDQAYFFN